MSETLRCTLTAGCPEEAACLKKWFVGWDRYCFRARAILDAAEEARLDALAEQRRLAAEARTS